MPEYVFPWGKYQGKTVEQVGLTDYPYLLWVRDWSVDKPRALSTQFREHISRVIHMLNNFVPAIGCQSDNCGSEAAYLAISVKPGGVAVSTREAYCPPHREYARTIGRQPYPIEFNTLRLLDGITKGDIKEVRDVLLQATGFNGSRVTRRVAHEFIWGLPLKVEYQESTPITTTPDKLEAVQTRLFE